MKLIGAHISSLKGIDKAVIRAHKINANTFSFFIGNHRKWKNKPLNKDIIRKFNKNCKKYQFNKKYIIPHSSYLINLGHPDKTFLEKSRKKFLNEMRCCETLNIEMLNFHPGSHLKKIDIKECIHLISKSINISLEKTKNVIPVIENTAGQGSNIGFIFEHIADIIKNINNKKRIGVCLDTCHMFASGYDIKTKEKFEETLYEFDKIIGFKYLKAMHLNDSKKNFGSRVDRHENLGKGFIGKNAFKFIMQDKRFNNIPLILETKNKKIWINEIRWLRSKEE